MRSNSSKSIPWLPPDFRSAAAAEAEEEEEEEGAAPALLDVFGVFLSPNRSDKYPS